MLKTTIAALAIALMTVPALAVTGEQVKACQQQLAAKNKADNAAAPAGFKPVRERGYSQNYIAECLSKVTTAAK
jgi:hypothetical protein